MNKIFKPLAAIAMVTAFGFSSTPALAVVFEDFTVQEGVVPGGTVSNQFTADKMTGNYVEVITFTGANTFSISLKWNAGQFVADNGVNPVGTQLGSFGAGGYGLYGLYQGSGTYSTIGGVTTFTTTPGVGGLSMYIDASQNTSFTAPGSGTLAWATGNVADDLLVATGSPLAGGGTLDPSLSTCGGLGGGINCGSFGTSTTFDLTAFGKTYFINPDPFFNLSFQSGQLNNFTIGGTQLINGSLDMVFGNKPIPEPASLALLGIGLVGMGVNRRRKASVL